MLLALVGLSILIGRCIRKKKNYGFKILERSFPEFYVVHLREYYVVKSSE